MVRIAYTLLAFASFFVAGLAASTAETTFSKLHADVILISTEATNLNTAVADFPLDKGTLKAATAIHAATVALGKSIVAGRADAQATPTLSTSDSHTILDAILSTKPVVLSITTALIKRKQSIMSIPVNGAVAIVLHDLSDLKASVDAFSIATAHIMTPSNASALQSYQTEIDSSLSAAITVFST